MSEPTQHPLFVETFNEALREAIKHMGGNKVVGQLLRPEKTALDAAGWLSDCMNPDRREKLDPEQVLFLLRAARKIGAHVAMNFIAADAGYSTPRPVEPEGEKARLQREFIESVRQQTRNIDRLERLQGGANGLRSA